MSAPDAGPPAAHGYSIRVRGLLGPSLHLALGGWPTLRTATTTVLHARLAPGTGPADAVALLRAQHLEVVSLVGRDRLARPGRCDEPPG